jgi:hypothetical protein
MKEIEIDNLYFISGYGNPQPNAPYPQQPPPPSGPGGMYPNIQGPPSYGVRFCLFNSLKNIFLLSFITGWTTGSFIPTTRILSTRSTINYAC